MRPSVRKRDLLGIVLAIVLVTAREETASSVAVGPLPRLALLSYASLVWLTLTSSKGMSFLFFINERGHKVSHRTVTTHFSVIRTALLYNL